MWLPLSLELDKYSGEIIGNTFKDEVVKIVRGGILLCELKQRLDLYLCATHLIYFAMLSNQESIISETNEI